LGLKEAANRIGFGETVAVRRTRFECSEESGFQNFNQPALEPSKRPALKFAAHGASPSMRERRINAYYDV
jgi:hypothetical protein